MVVASATSNERRTMKINLDLIAVVAVAALVLVVLHIVGVL
jgi:hypothetical protein